MDVLIFSKDRGFQLFTLLETLTDNVSGMDNIIVQFSYSNNEFLKGYKILNKYFPNVTFVDETELGFYTTLSLIISEEIQSDNVFLEVDDVIYYDKLDLNKLNNVFNNHPNASKISVSLNSSIFNSDYYVKEKEYLIVDRNRSINNNIQNLVLKYPFNASGAIHRKNDLQTLININIINNPIDLEIKGSTSNVFNLYSQTLYNDKEVNKQMHTNNTLKRYKELYTTEYLNSLLLNKEVLSTDNINIEEMEDDMRWFNGEDIGRFPIFPWEISPKYHDKIINNRKIIQI